MWTKCFPKVFENFSLNRRQSQKNCHYYTSIRPIIILSRCFGLNSFSFKTNAFDQIDRTDLSIFDVFCFVVAITLYTSSALALIASIQLGLQPEYQSIYLLLLGDQLLLAFQLIVCTISVIMDMMNRDRILATIQQFEEFDKEVKMLLQQLKNYLIHLFLSLSILAAFSRNRKQ